MADKEQTVENLDPRTNFAFKEELATLLEDEKPAPQAEEPPAAPEEKAEEQPKEEAQEKEEPKAEEKKEEEKAEEKPDLENLKKQFRAEYEKEFEEKFKAATQSRIDELIARNKRNEDIIERLAAQQPKSDASNDPMASLVQAKDEILKHKNDIIKRKIEAMNAGDVEAAVRLDNEETSVILQMIRLDEEYKKVINDRRQQADRVVVDTRRDEWLNSWSAAIAEFPELAKDGKLDESSSLFKKALAILGTDAKPSKYHTWLDAVNPRYDHSAGPYAAVLRALVDAKDSEVKVKETKAEKQVKQLKAKEQMLSQTHAQSGEITDEIRDKKFLDTVTSGNLDEANDLAFQKRLLKKAGLTRSSKWQFSRHTMTATGWKMS